MGLSVGIVGLPNVGKSTLFNAITNSAVEAQNYPFCTIEPNVGIVPVPDSRLSVLSKISQTEKIIYATIEFTDIAGLVKGASQGEGLGNKFLSNIRETSAIAHVIRCFEDDNIVHVHGKVNPVDDASVINLELILADLEMSQKLVQTQQKKTKTNQKDELAKLALFEKITAHLEESLPLRQLDLSKDEHVLLQGIYFLTSKKMIYVANISESDIGKPVSHVQALMAYAKSQGDAVLVVCANLEQELSQLSPEEKAEMLGEMGLQESGLDQLARACYSALGLQTYLTTGQKETRAWTIRKGDTAPQAAGVIHTDFEKGFIRANIISYTDFVACNGLKLAKEKGLIRQEGKEYIMQEGDIVEFLFNV